MKVQCGTISECGKSQKTYFPNMLCSKIKLWIIALIFGNYVDGLDLTEIILSHSCWISGERWKYLFIMLISSHIKRRTNIFLYVYIIGCSTKNVDVPHEIYYAIELFPENENKLRASRGEEKHLLLMMFSRCNHVYVYIYIPEICN